VRGDQVDVLGQPRVFLPDVPLLRGGDRNFYRGTHPVENHRQLVGGDFLAEDRLVTHHHPHDAAGGIGQFDGTHDFPLVALQVRADPDPQGHAQAELFREPRDVFQAAVHRIGTDVVGQLAHDLQVATHFIVGRVLVLLRELALLERRVGKTGDLFRPVGGRDRAIDQRPETGEQRGNGQHYHQVESKFTR